MQPCSHAHIGRVRTACVSSPRDVAVSTGSHMQQDMDISKAPTHLSAPLPLFDPVYLRKPRHQKLAKVSPETQFSFVSVTTRVFRPAGRILHEWCYEQNNSQNTCSCCRCRFVHDSNFRRHGIGLCEKEFVPETATLDMGFLWRLCVQAHRSLSLSPFRS